ncbi:MAG: BolA family transcriptional regulator [Proteobacteria bacterium]|nr:BolA family transcriptional regulator [Pseudomonadota bacterium]
MALQILNAGPDPQEIARKLETAIVEALPGARVEVLPAGPGHFEIKVVSDAFAGKKRVQQQQLVYGAITPFLSGPNAPVHAIDAMVCELPD